MKLHDTVAGFLVLAFGTAVALYAQTFPPMPGQNIGPSLFPTLIGLATAILGAALIVSGVKQGDGASWVVVDAWVARRPMALNFAAVIGVLLFYAVAVDWLGFFITGVTFLLVLMQVFGVTRRWILPLAAGVTIAIHYGFYTLLRVPLPWGLLEGIAW